MTITQAHQHTSTRGSVNTCNGKPWTEGTAIEVATGERARFVASHKSMLFVHGLPIFASHDLVTDEAGYEALA